MKYLLDTHTLLWFLSGDKRLSAKARRLIENPNNVILLSIASIWEIAIKVSLGKLQLHKPFDELFPDELHFNDIKVLDITVESLIKLIAFPLHHRDPFDRLIIAQSVVEECPIIGVDPSFDAYGISRDW